MQKYLVGRGSREQQQTSTAEKTNMEWIKPQLYAAVPQMPRSAMAGNNVNPFLIINCDDGKCAAALQISSCCIVAALITRNHLYKVLNFIHNYSHHEWTIYFAEDCQH